MRKKTAFAPMLVGAFIGTALLLSACNSRTQNPVDAASADATEASTQDAVVDVGPTGDPSDGATQGLAASNLDLDALVERKDPERVLRFYVSAIREKDWVNASRAWSLDAEMSPAKLQAEFGGQAGPRMAVGKGDTTRAAGALSYEAPLVVDFSDGRPSKRGTIILRRVNDMPGASDEQLTWRIERTSTLIP